MTLRELKDWIEGHGILEPRIEGVYVDAARWFVAEHEATAIQSDRRPVRDLGLMLLAGTAPIDDVYIEQWLKDKTKSGADIEQWLKNHFGKNDVPLPVAQWEFDGDFNLG